MTHFLITEDKPDGYRLEDILKIIRKDIFLRTTKIMDDDRAEAQIVMNNNVEILGLLSAAIAKAEESTTILQKSFGPSREGEPRIGV
ncbi:histidine kinase [Paremcibacter congregatus]|uniref:Histidine kinase n=1 Tax=Paremcibacter congregatus TaxID=2043170 RepID=A0A2G4YV74_9PROT|nr:histidine kinase [Paremcibacter congregatus]PHZ86229.1 histidine kinase [Paremcibacter congregatus]QDE27195.1 histidine kinase [Paremcibacter congregatus]